MMPEINTLVIVDTVKTTDTHSNKSAGYNKVVYRRKLSYYAHHAACGISWKTTIYIVGGELEGNWIPTGYAINLLNGLSINQIEDSLTLLKMTSMAPVNREINSGFFIAGLVVNEDEGVSAV